MSRQRDGMQVRASDVGKAAYCPYQLHLQSQGVKPDRVAKKAMKRGDQGHRSWAKARRADRSGAPAPLRVLITSLILAALILALIGVLNIWLSG